MAAAFTVFGTIFLTAVLLPANAPQPSRHTIKRLAWVSLCIALAAALVWFILESADLADAEDITAVIAALPVVALSTRFGHLLIGRCVALSVAMLCFQFGRTRSAAVLAGLAVGADAWLDHGGAMTGNIGTLLLVSTICHLLSGAAWLGSLPSLRLAIKHLPIVEAARIARRFSPIGMICVFGLIVSGTVQYLALIGMPFALINNDYGRVALLKIILLAALIGLAAFNRYRLTPFLAAKTTAGCVTEISRRKFMHSIAAEITLGLLILFAAGLLLQLTPPSMALMFNEEGGS